MTTSTDGLIVAASLAALFFGIQLVLYALLGYTLLTGGAFKGRAVVLSTASLLTLMSLSNVALSIIYAEASTGSEIEKGAMAGIDVTIKVFGRISLLIAQLIVIWRTWILWQTSVVVRALLAFLAFASCTTTIISIGLCFVASLSTATVASDALVMLIPLIVTNIVSLLATWTRLWGAPSERSWSDTTSSHRGRMARIAVFFLDSGLILGAFLILYLGSEVSSGDLNARRETAGGAAQLTRALTGAASGVAGTIGILVLLLVVHRVSTADVLLYGDSDDAGTARDDHTLASSSTWRMSKKWKGEKEKWDQSDFASSDRATISTVDELPRYSRHMRDVKAFPVQEPPSLSPPRLTRPLHVEKATRPTTEGAVAQEHPRSWFEEHARCRVDHTECRPHSSPSMRPPREEIAPSVKHDASRSGERNTTPAAEQDIVEVSTAPTPHTVFAGWQTDRPLELRPFTLPPPTSRPRTAHPAYPLVTRPVTSYAPRRGSLPAQSPPRATGASQPQASPSHSARAPPTSASHTARAPPASRPSAASKRPSHTYSSSYVASPLHSIRELPPPPAPESEADASESTYVHAPESLYSRAPDSDGAPSPQSSVESIADPPTAWRWPGPNPSSGTVYRGHGDHGSYQHHDYAPYRHHALSRSAVSNLSSPSAYSVDSMALAIRDAADPLELYGNYLWGLKMAGEGESEEKRSHGDHKQTQARIEMDADQAVDTVAEQRPLLPLELLEHIAGYTDRSTQLMLALVCHALVNFSRRHTFQALYVRQTDEVLSGMPRLASATFATLLGSPICSFGTYTKSLTLTPGNYEEGLFKMLRHLPNLTDLRFEGTRSTLCVLTDDHLHPSPSHFPTLTNLTLNYVVLQSFSTLTSILVASPQLCSIELLWVSTRQSPSADTTVDPSTSARLVGTLAQLRSLQMKIVYGISNQLQRHLLAWILELPQFPRVEELGITLHGSDSSLPRPLNAFMRGTVLSLKKWTINPDEYRNFLRTDLCGLDFSQFLVLHTVILDPIGLCTVRMQDRREDGRLLRFMLQVLAAPALQTLIIHLKVDEDHSILDWETEQLDWAALDAALVEHPSLEQAWFAFHLSSAFLLSEPAKRAMFTSVSYLPKFLPRTNAKGMVRPGILPQNSGEFELTTCAVLLLSSDTISFNYLYSCVITVGYPLLRSRIMHVKPDEATPRLPFELLELISDLANADTQLVLGLVCRALVECSRRNVYKQLCVIRSEPRSWAASDDESDSFAEFVHLLTLRQHLTRKEGLPSTFLGRLSALTDLCLEGRDFRASCVLEDLHPISSGVPALTNLFLTHVVLARFSALASALCALPQLQGLCLNGLYVQYEDEAADPANDIPPKYALTNLRRLRLHLQWSGDACTLRSFLAWMLALPNIAPVENLDILLSSTEVDLSPLVCSLMRRLATSLAQWRVAPSSEIWYGFMGVDFSSLHFPRFRSMHTIVIDPVSEYQLRFEHPGALLIRFVRRILTTSSLRRLVVRVRMDDNRWPANDRWPPAVDWLELDHGVVGHPLLEEVSLVFYCCYNIDSRDILSECLTRAPEVMPMTKAKGILRVEVSDKATGYRASSD
ncbi:uncharacterized protein SCHCODRAFT_01193964 [Schizophyllum commune H4-8]|nr:uncharacterized protein SCHCODRAFT_01193964 [Schizophyllum commune H4-8]KAI5885090.1 hypothetical protein SCHCODRAFT_01193964 [Schizophyllum commune H4-8]